jgi:putative methionine-R-sulfoxide reductase with GAF domain
MAQRALCEASARRYYRRVSDRDPALESLLAVTDTSLTELDVDDLLGELLSRIRTILDADTAAVLLREADSEVLIARAARGLEDEVREGVLIPVGRGFAGAIAATKRPVILDRIDSTTVANPILWEKGIQTMLGVPLLHDERLIGVLHVGRLEQRPFTEHDTVLLQVAGERVAAAIESRRLAVEVAAARELERSLQPARLPRLAGIEFAGRYVPSERRAIGGDWYDAFVLPGGRLWVVTGDVAGHGLNAAVVMGRVKSALRSFTLVRDHAADVLALTDRKVHFFEFGTMITVVVATAIPPYDRWEIASAGHLPPVFVGEDQPAELLRIPVGPPLGVELSTERSAVEVTLAPGSVMLFYTDGLVERRQVPMDERLETLRETVISDDPESVCRTVMHRLIDAPTDDDIAVLAIRRTP